MSGSTATRESGQGRSRLLFLSVAVLALCMIVPGFRGFAGVFAIALGLLSISLVGYLIRLFIKRER